MKVSEVYEYIDSFAPFSEQADWDNSGVLMGTPEKETAKALVCLDLTEAAAAYAVSQGCGLIVSHHPVIFRGVKQIAYPSVFTELIRGDVSVISAHTNLDIAPGGVNDTLCETLGMDYEKAGPSIGDGFLNFGFLPQCRNAGDLARYLHDTLHAPVRYMDALNEIGKIAVCAGSGGEFYREARSAGCTALITGDADHHDFLEAAAIGVSLFAAGHYETEAPIVPKLAEMLSARFPQTEFIVFPGKNPLLTLAD